MTALGFAFDPRYRDFPYASLTMAVLPLFALALLNRPPAGARPIAEAAFAGLFALARCLYACSTRGRRTGSRCGPVPVYALLAITLWRARGEQSPK